MSLQSNWVKFLALFIVLFALFDFCTPESCDAQALPRAAGVLQAQSSTDGAAGGETCQFEEDCFNCAHYSPAPIILLDPVDMLAEATPESYSSPLDGIPVIPYHPPRF